MPLGIEADNVAPQLIQNSGQALVQGIRQIGQQISQHLTEIQTRRDLGALAQETQGLNPQSNDFPMQLAQLTSRHPLAARDERAKMMLIPLGAAHAQWQAEESDVRSFNRAMAMQTRRTQDAKNTFTFEQDYKRSHPQYIPGVGVTTLEDPNDPTGQPNVLLPAPARTGSNRPIVAKPGDILFDPTGKQIAANPKPEGLPAAQAATDARLQKKMKMDLLDRQDKQTQAEIEASIRRRDALTHEKMKLGKDADVAYYDNTIKAIEGEVEGLRKRRLDIQKAIEGIESRPAETLAAPPAAGADDLGLPPVAPNSASAEDLPVLSPADAAKLPKGTKFKGTNGGIYYAR